jgi:drug/metabolite transporter (DMT)-like permease
VVSVLGAWLIYDQQLGLVQVFGALLVIAGLAGTVWDRRSSVPTPEPVS